ncbi:MAG: DUF2283 domain-containing protein [bacterium]|nr:DUF2283 domain-containing protein [bacterium]
MKITYNKESDILYVQFNTKKIFKTKEIGEDFLIDVDTKGTLVGIEVLDYSTQKTKDAFQISSGKEKIAII